tara:strand:+ start:5488 stop:5934 length:447 start_codon:yes stop_codon:yes gene_type:complete
MDFRKKIFVNKDLNEAELIFVRDSLTNIDLKIYLDDSFIYISVHDNGTLEVVSIKDEYVYLVSKEFFITNKMAVEYLRNKSKIEQKLNEVLYWNGINNLKKYIPVSLDDGKNKEYLDTPVYAENIIHAIKTLDDMRIDNYMYLEDVDE